MDTTGFYKMFGTELLYAQNEVNTPIVYLTRVDMESYTYPADGWYWFGSQEQANEFFKYNRDAVTPTLDMYVEQVQEHLDRVAKTRNYDGILSLCSYVTSKDPQFSVEGQAGVDWRDSVWRTCYTILADVNTGNRPAPSISQLLSELPNIEW